MKKVWIMSVAMGALLFTACERDPAATSNQQKEEVANTTLSQNKEKDVVALAPDSVYRGQAAETSEKMAEDLKFDEEGKQLAEEILYNRNKRRAEVQQEFPENEYRLEKEIATIEVETEEQLQGIMSYDQFKEYVINRQAYAAQDGYVLQQSANDQSGGMDDSTATTEDSEQNAENQKSGATDKRN